MEQVDHFFRSEENLKFLDKLETLNFSNYDWMGTVVFYIALHKTKAKLINDFGISLPINDHETLRGEINRKFPNIFDDYLFLHTESRRYRYELKTTDIVSQKHYEYCKDILLRKIIPFTDS